MLQPDEIAYLHASLLPAVVVSLLLEVLLVL